MRKWVAIKKLKTPWRGVGEVGGWVQLPFLTTWILKIWEIYKYKSAKIGISGNFADFNRYFVNFERFLRYGWYGHIKYVSKMGWVGGSKCHSWPHGKWTTWCARFFYCHPLGICKFCFSEVISGWLHYIQRFVLNILIATRASWMKVPKIS